MNTINLFFVQTIDMFGDNIVELRSSEKSFEDLTEDDDYHTYLGTLTLEDAAEMELKGYEPGNESECIQYAKDILGILIPDNYNLICRGL